MVSTGSVITLTTTLEGSTLIDAAQQVTVCVKVSRCRLMNECFPQGFTVTFFLVGAYYLSASRIADTYRHV